MSVSRPRKLFSIFSGTTVEEIKNIPKDYTGVAVYGIGSLEAVQAIPRHTYEVEPMNRDVIGFLRTLPRHVHTLVVSDKTHRDVFKPFSRSLKNVRIAGGTYAPDLPPFHKYIEKVTYPNGLVEYLNASESNDSAEPVYESKTTTHTKETFIETTSGKRVEKVTEKDEEKSETIRKPTRKRKRAAEPEIQQDVAEEAMQVEEKIIPAPVNKRAKTNEEKQPSNNVELSDVEGLDEPLADETLSRVFDMLSISKLTPLSDIKKSTCTTALVLSSGCTPSKLTGGKRIKRFEFGGDIDGSDIHEFPALTQVKLFHGLKPTTITKLKADIRWVVIDKYLDKSPGEDIFDENAALVTDKNRAKQIGFNQTLEVIAKLKETLNPRLAVAITVSVKPFTRLKAANAGVNDVEINAQTTVHAVQRLAGLGVYAVWLGQNVKPEVVAAIPADIQHVVVGYDVCVESFAAIAKAKIVSFVAGVDMALYEDTIFDQIEDVKQEAFIRAETAASAAATDMMISWLELFNQPGMIEKEDRAAHILDPLSSLADEAVKVPYPAPAPAPVAIAPQAAFFQAAPVIQAPQRILIDLVSDSDEELSSTVSIMDIIEISSDEEVNEKEENSDDIPLVSLRTRSKRK